MSEITKNIENWLQSQVSAGRFKDVPEALNAVVEHYQMSVIEARQDDLWVKPLLDKAIESLDAGKGKSSKAIHARLRKELNF